MIEATKTSSVPSPSRGAHPEGVDPSARGSRGVNGGAADSKGATGTSKGGQRVSGKREAQGRDTADASLNQFRVGPGRVSWPKDQEPPFVEILDLILAAPIRDGSLRALERMVTVTLNPKERVFDKKRMAALVSAAGDAVSHAEHPERARALGRFIDQLQRGTAWKASTVVPKPEQTATERLIDKIEEGRFVGTGHVCGRCGRSRDSEEHWRGCPLIFTGERKTGAGVVLDAKSGEWVERKERYTPKAKASEGCSDILRRTRANNHRWTSRGRLAVLDEYSEGGVE